MHERKPLHLLIEGDRRFTRTLRNWHPGRPLIVTSNPATEADGYPTAHLKPGECANFQLLESIIAFRDGRFDELERIEAFSQLLSEMRERFHLAPDETLVLAFGGSHTSHYHHKAAGASLSYAENSVSIFNELQKMKTERSLAKTLDRVVELLVERSGQQVAIEWITSIFPELLPDVPLPPDLEVLLAKAKSDAASAGRNNSDPRFKRGAVPLLYIREGGGGWQRLSLEKKRSIRTTTLSLIEQFAAKKRVAPDTEGVLFKLLGSKLEHHAKADPPIMGHTTLERAQEAGLNSIVLDHRCGVIAPDALDAIKHQQFSIPVYSSYCPDRNTQ